MRKEQIRRALRSFAGPLMGVQIALGIFTIFRHFSLLPTYQESREYLEAGLALRFDEYTGVVYPLFLAGVSRLSFAHEWVYAALIQGIQLLCFYMVSFLFFGLWTGDKKKKAFLSGFLTTIPGILLLHLSALPQSFQLSFCLLLITCMLYVFQKKAGWNKLVIPVVVIALVVSICNLTMQVPGSRGKMQKSVEATMLQRFVWPHFGTNYFWWDQEVQAVMSQNEAITISRFENKVVDEFGPKMEQAYGEKEARRHYLAMTKSTITQRTKEVCLDILADARDYALIPYTEMRNLKGIGTSETGWNYRKWMEHSGLVERAYWWYGRAISLLLAVAGLISLIVAEKEVRRHTGLLLAAVFAYINFVIVVFRDNVPVDGRHAGMIMMFYGLIGLFTWKWTEDETHEESAH